MWNRRFITIYRSNGFVLLFLGCQCIWTGRATPSPPPATYIVGTANTTSCPGNSVAISTAAACEAAAVELQLVYKGVDNSTDEPPQCYKYSSSAVSFNLKSGNVAGDGAPICILMMRAFISYGTGSVCRVDTKDSSLDGQGTAQMYHGVRDISECKQKCQLQTPCFGIEYSHNEGRCEVWTVFIGHTKTSGASYECVQYIQSDLAETPVPPTAMCGSFMCPDYHIPKSTSSSLVGNDRDACCDPVCSAVACPDQYILKSPASSIVGDNWDLCCDQTCAGFTCPDNYTLKSDAALGGNSQGASGIRGNDETVCCDPLCIGFACEDNYVLKSPASIVGNDQGACCDKACQSFACPSNYILKPDALHIAGTDLLACCDQEKRSEMSSAEDTAVDLTIVLAICVGCLVTSSLVICAICKVCRDQRRGFKGSASALPANIVNQDITISYTVHNHGSRANPHNTVSPSKWCITGEQFFTFIDEVARCLTSEEPNFYDVADHLVKPATQPFDCSYALMLNPKGVTGTMYVVHAWAGNIFSLTGALRDALESGSGGEGLWVCLFAIPQTWDESRTKALLGAHPYSSPFYIALSSIPVIVAVRCPGVNIYAKLWCVFEMWVAHDLGKNVIPLGWMDMDVDLANIGCSGSCTNPHDTELLRYALSGKEDAVNVHIAKIMQEKRPSAIAGVKSKSTALSRAGSFRSARKLPEGKKYHYFMSHKKHHSALGKISASLALAIHDALNGRGFVGFFDVDNLEEVSQHEVEDAVKSSCAMLVCLTDETCQSEWCRFEWNVARQHRIPAKGIVDLQNFSKSKIVEQVQETSPYLLSYQMSEYTEKTRKMVTREITFWLEKRLEDLASGVDNVRSRGTSNDFTDAITVRLASSEEFDFYDITEEIV